MRRCWRLKECEKGPGSRLGAVIAVVLASALGAHPPAFAAGADSTAAPDTAAARAPASSMEGTGPAGAVLRYSFQLKSQDPEIRLAAVGKLSAMGAGAAPAVPQIADVLLDNDPRVRLAMIELLRKLGPRAAAAEPAMVPLLLHEDSATRLAAAVALGEFGVPAACSPLIDVLLDEVPEVRAAAATSLARYGTAGKLGIPRLEKMTKEENEVVRAAATAALPKVAPVKNRVAFLVADLNSPVIKTRGQTAAALEEMGREALPAVPTLRRLTRDPDEAVRFTAAKALLSIAPDSASVQKAFLALVVDLRGERAHRVGLVASMNKLGLPVTSTIPTLLAQLDLPQFLDRKAAATLLGRIKPTTEPVIQKLATTLKKDPEPEVRAAVANALGNLGVDAKSAIPTLEDVMMHDPNKDVRVYASMSLDRVRAD